MNGMGILFATDRKSGSIGLVKISGLTSPEFSRVILNETSLKAIYLYTEISKQMTVSISIDLVGFSPVFHSLIFEKIAVPNWTSKVCWLETSNCCLS